MPYLPIEQAVADLENRKRDRLPYVSDLPTQSLATAGSTVSDASDINATLVLIIVFLHFSLFYSLSYNNRHKSSICK